MQKNTLIILFGTLFLASCGGGSNSADSAIEGKWEGNLLEGTIICSNGTSSGVGAGELIRKLSLDITGSDELNSDVQVTDGNCVLVGKRSSDGFTATPHEGCPTDLLEIQFTVHGKNDASVAYNNAPQVNNGVSCDSTSTAQLSR